MKKEEYLDIYQQIMDSDYSHEIELAEQLAYKLISPYIFADEVIWFICSSSMKEEVARKIEKRVLLAIERKQPIYPRYLKHKQKAKAIQYIYDNKDRLYVEWLRSEDQLTYLETLPHIGPITKYHLAKNLGIDVIKPDRHLVRIAKSYGMDPLEMCKKLKRETGHTLVVIDMVFRIASNLGWK